MWSTLFFFILLSTSSTYGAKILGVFHVSARSHYILGSSLMRALAEKGHDVTVISCFGEKELPKNGTYRDIILTGFKEEHDKKIKKLNMFENRFLSSLLMSPIIAVMAQEMTEKTIEHPNVQKLLNSDETFDVVIVEEFFNPALKALASHFKAHLIVLSTVGANNWINDIVGNSNPISYVPAVTLGYSSPMTFSERLFNTVDYIFQLCTFRLYVFPKQQQLIKKHFPNSPDVDEIVYNTSLVLLNSHPSISQPVPYVPQMVDIGGFHVKPPKKLPKDLQTYLDNAKNGVIYFSLGSHLKSSLLPEYKRNMFLNVFAKLKHDVLWKWEEDNLPGKPSNVRTEKWLPQQDILAHPNVKMFITHSGLLSTIEIAYHGVPVLALPIGGDQKLNAQRLVNQGFGLTIPFHDLTEEIFLEKINQLLENPKFRENAQKKSKIFHDRLVHPMDTALYWIEYVIRNNGTSHLRVAGLDLPWYKYFLVDIFLFILAVVLVKIYLTKIVMKKLISYCCKKKEQKLKKQ